MQKKNFSQLFALVGVFLLSALLQGAPAHAVNIVPWKQFNYTVPLALQEPDVIAKQALLEAESILGQAMSRVSCAALDATGAGGLPVSQAGALRRGCIDHRMRDMCLKGPISAAKMTYGLEYDNKRRIINDDYRQHYAAPVDEGIGGTKPPVATATGGDFCMPPKNTVKANPVAIQNGYLYRDYVKGAKWRMERGLISDKALDDISIYKRLDDKRRIRQQSFFCDKEEFGDNCAQTQPADDQYKFGDFFCKMPVIRYDVAGDDGKPEANPYEDPMAMRVALDSCANQFIGYRSLEEDYAFDRDGRPHNLSALYCQRLQTIPYDAAKDPGFAPWLYLQRSYKDYLEEGYGTTEYDPFHDANVKYAVEGLGRKGAERFGTEAMQKRTDISAILGHQVERIIDFAHPFSPRQHVVRICDEGDTECEADPGKGKILNDRMYGYKTVTDEWGKGYFLAHEGPTKSTPVRCAKTPVDVMEWRREPFEKCLDCRIKKNEKCLWDEARTMQVVNDMDLYLNSCTPLGTNFPSAYRNLINPVPSFSMLPGFIKDKFPAPDLAKAVVSFPNNTKCQKNNALYKGMPMSDPVIGKNYATFELWANNLKAEHGNKFANADYYKEGQGADAKVATLVIAKTFQHLVGVAIHRPMFVGISPNPFWNPSARKAHEVQAAAGPLLLTRYLKSPKSRCKTDHVKKKQWPPCTTLYQEDDNDPEYCMQDHGEEAPSCGTWGACCSALAAPIPSLNVLKIRNLEDGYDAAVDGPIPDGHSFSEYFGNHRPYMRWWDTGAEAGQSGPEFGLMDLSSDKGAKDVVVGVGRDWTGSQPAKMCRFTGARADGPGSLRNQGPTSWTELKLYQANSFRKAGLNCLAQYDKIFKGGASEERPPLETVGSYSHTTADGKPLSYLMPSGWRGYVSEPDEAARFPGIAGEPRNFVATGLDNVRVGDWLVWDHDLPPPPTGDDDLAPPAGMTVLPRAAIVQRVEEIGTSLLAGKSRRIDVLEFDYGKNPDICGTTDMWSDGTTRSLYKPGGSAFQNNIPPNIKTQFNTARGVYPANATSTCDDPALTHCVERDWERIKIYRPRDPANRRGEPPPPPPPPE